MRTRSDLSVTEKERAELARIIRRQSTSPAVAKRCQAILLDDGGLTYAEIGAQLRMRKQTVHKWRSRFQRHRITGLSDMPRPGAKRRLTKARIARVLKKTLKESPPNGGAWTLRTMAAKTGISRSSVNSIWKSAGITPRARRAFDLTREPSLLAGVHDILGLFIRPPKHAMVLYVNESSKLRAIRRLEHPADRRHAIHKLRSQDWSRRAICRGIENLVTGLRRAFEAPQSRYRSHDFSRFLLEVEDAIEISELEDASIHLICDSYPRYTTPSLREFLVYNSTAQVHFAASPASWLEQVQCAVNHLENRRRRGKLTSLDSLEPRIHDDVPIRHFFWTARQYRNSLAQAEYRRKSTAFDELRQKEFFEMFPLLPDLNLVLPDLNLD